jgi:hypothetical protein
MCFSGTSPGARNGSHGSSIGVLIEQTVGREKLLTHPKLLDFLMSEVSDTIPYV